MTTLQSTTNVGELIIDGGRHSSAELCKAGLPNPECSRLGT